MRVLVTELLEELLDLLLEPDEIELLDLLLEDAAKLELAAEELDLLTELAALELRVTLDLLELIKLELDTALDLLLEDVDGFELELELTKELDLLDTTFILETDDVVTTGTADNDETDVAELMLLKLELNFELELNWFSLGTGKLFTDDASLDTWFDIKLVDVKLLETELLELEGSAISGLLNVDLFVPSPSTPAAPPQAVNTMVKIMPQKGSLAVFSAEKNIFLYH
jgi:hypothetical protein